MKKVFSTDNCYEGFSTIEDSLVIGSLSELYASDEIEENSISWNDNAFEEEKAYFMSFLDAMIKGYEKQYRTTVSNIALVGRVGLWNNNPVGGKILNVDDNPLENIGRVDAIDVEVDEDGLVTINGHHHDGTHRMNIYLLTENKLKKVSPNFISFGVADYDDMERIYKELIPLKMNKIGVGFYGSYEEQKAS